MYWILLPFVMLFLGPIWSNYQLTADPASGYTDEVSTEEGTGGVPPHKLEGTGGVPPHRL